MPGRMKGKKSSGHDQISSKFLIAIRGEIAYRNLIDPFYLSS